MAVLVQEILHTLEENAVPRERLLSSLIMDHVMNALV